MYRICISILLLSFFSCMAQQKTQTFSADHPAITYTGRIDFSDPKLPTFYAPGVYFEFDYEGSYCDITLIDEALYGKNHNYISILIDQEPVQRLKLASKENKIRIGEKLAAGRHHVLICKGTEANIGSLALKNIQAEQIYKSLDHTTRKIEFYGNSITCGTGSNLSIPCGTGEWSDQHDAYAAYGPILARSLHAKWQLTSYSGIGLMHSCCDLKFTMPDIYDKINLRDNRINWNFSTYQPDLVCVTLGQNDGFQPAELFIKNYIDFLKKLRQKYPKAEILCLSSPMADPELKSYFALQLPEIVKRADDTNINYYLFQKSYNSGCDSHPDAKEHVQIAQELEHAILKQYNWKK
ncbi:GDSL-type esterase/lipase family protein [Sphingobacterium sp. PCS056]|uniref:SGNH/GDSL hydrolase family protein n=1 Tax=unclassified Sphingobacterium TaxID=2609468 RepID=UPI00200F53C9|nr:MULTISPECIES: SGNH/GDSL hydrolase family protein [unclassified Sphingobacterium]UPZ36364.1 GDSL-type esterase/lipase family protein [Sphingobacterium sp. PCS056]